MIRAINNNPQREVRTTDIPGGQRITSSNGKSRNQNGIENTVVQIDIYSNSEIEAAHSTEYVIRDLEGLESYEHITSREPTLSEKKYALGLMLSNINRVVDAKNYLFNNRDLAESLNREEAADAFGRIMFGYDTRFPGNRNQDSASESLFDELKALRPDVSYREDGKLSLAERERIRTTRFTYWNDHPKSRFPVCLENAIEEIGPFYSSVQLEGYGSEDFYSEGNETINSRSSVSTYRVAEKPKQNRFSFDGGDHFIS